MNSTGFASLDAKYDQRREKRQYEKVRKAEYRYGIRLRKIAQAVGDIVESFKPGDPKALPKIESLLRKYAELITPWGEVIAASMLADVAQRDEQMWAQQTKGMGIALRIEIAKAPTGETLRKLQAEQVKLITSIPLKAAQRVHKLTMEGLISSARASEIAKDIQRTTHVEKSRATLIARTEVGRASTNLSQARALHIGSDGYIWRTAEDNDVRKSHKKMEGVLVKWSKPPTLDKLTGHAGCLPNCRCYPEIVIPRNY